MVMFGGSKLTDVVKVVCNSLFTHDVQLKINLNGQKGAAFGVGNDVFLSFFQRK
jgi:hypothetical protein